MERTRSACRPPSPARAPRPRAPRSCGSSPDRCTSGPRGRVARGRRPGTARTISSTSSTRAWASANARAPSTCLVNRARRPASRLGDGVDRPAGAAEGDAERGTDRTGPDDARSRASRPTRSAGAGGCARRGATSPSPCRWWPGGTGSRSMPASTMAASVSARSRSGSSPGSRPQGFTGGRGARPGARARSQRRARYACMHRV